MNIAKQCVVCCLVVAQTALELTYSVS